MDTGNKKECSTQQKRLLGALENREAIREGMNRACEALRVLESHKNVLLDILKIHDRRMDIVTGEHTLPHVIRPCGSIKAAPLHVRGENYLLMVYSLGRLPGPNMRLFYSHKCIYPIDYMCKRVYYRYGPGVDRANRVSIYSCYIRNVHNKPVFEIAEGTHLRIRGKASEVFSVFKSLFPTNIDFASLQDFFGLNNPDVRRLLSEMEGFNDLGIGAKGSG